MSWLGYVASSLATLLNMSQVPFAFSGKATTTLPYLNTLCVCVLWLAYAIAHNDLFIYIPNAFGIMSGLICIIGTNNIVWWHSCILLVAFFLFYISDQIPNVYRYILIVTGICLFIAPVYDIVECWKRRVVIQTSWLFVVVSIVNTAVWIAYGVYHRLWTVWLSNAIGLTLITIQTIVILIYNKYIL